MYKLLFWIYCMYIPVPTSWGVKFEKFIDERIPDVPE